MAAESTTANPQTVIDTVSGLLVAEQNNMIRFMHEGSPYLTRAGGEIRKPLADMVATHSRHCWELYRLIDYLGGVPQNPEPQPEEQYLAFLSLSFLLPKLVSVRKETIDRYTKAIASLGKAPAEVKGLLQAHLADHQRELQILEKAVVQVSGSKN